MLTWLRTGRYSGRIKSWSCHDTVKQAGVVCYNPTKAHTITANHIQWLA